MSLKKIIGRIADSVRSYFPPGESTPPPENYARRIIEATDNAILEAQARLEQIRKELSPEERAKRRNFEKRAVEYFNRREYRDERPTLVYHPPEEQND